MGLAEGGREGRVLKKKKKKKKKNARRSVRYHYTPHAIDSPLSTRPNDYPRLPGAEEATAGRPLAIEQPARADDWK